MRLQLEATPAELWTKGSALLEELAKAFADINPDLAEALEKALPPKEQDLKFRALQGLKAVTTEEYDRMLKRMLGDIGKVLDKSVSGNQFVKALQEEMQSAGEHVEHLIKQLGPPEKDEDEEPEEDEEPLEPGDYDPKTDEIVPEPEEEEEEEEETEKADASQSEPVQDFTKPIADKDARAYERVKKVLIGRGYTEADFQKDGPLYGYSVNELIDLVREKKAG